MNFLTGTTQASALIEERPLVTFALFAFNQEKYIGEALAGAFAQTYEPLEIILSDDCSTDRTFEIMEDLVAQYRGPHKVYLLRNSENLGVLKHVIHISRKAHGDFLVFAAGDDISKPFRTSRLTQMWRKGFDAVFSNYDIIDAQSTVVASDRSPKGNASSRLPWLKNIECDYFVYGSTSSYSKEIIENLIEPYQKIQSEDAPLNTIIHLLGKSVCYVSESLVAYRVHSETLSASIQVSADLRLIVENEINEQRRANFQYALMVYLRELLFSLQDKKNISVSIDLHLIESEIEFASLKSIWSRLSFSERLVKISSSRNSKIIKWSFLRLAGVWSYAALKWIHRKVSSSSYSELK